MYKLAAMGDNQVETKEDWLRLQEQTRHDRIVTVNQGLTLTPSLYFGTRRCTYSDVMSVITTATPLQPPAPPPPPPDGSHQKATISSTKKSLISKTNGTQWVPNNLKKQPKPKCTEEEQLPFPQSNMPRDNGYVHAPLEGDTERTKRFLARQCFALSQERAMFMATLHHKRRQRFLLEHHAALVIQRVYRGFLLRRRFMSIKQKLRVRKRIRINLVKVTKGTAIITGEKDRKARILAARNDAARKIQFCFKRSQARRLLQRERILRTHELRHKKVMAIQRMWRKCVAKSVTRKLRARQQAQLKRQLACVVSRLYQGYQARQRVRRIRLRLQVYASQRIQNFVQRFHARKALASERKRQDEDTRHRAAIRIQRIVRGGCARRRVMFMRHEEDSAIRVACVLSMQRVARGFLARRKMRYFQVFHTHSIAWKLALDLTRIVRGFLARQQVKARQMDQEIDLLVQTKRGNTSTVIDLLDGYGLVEEPVEMTCLNYGSQNNMLHLAATFGRMEILTHVLPKFLTDAPEMIYAVNGKGETPLKLAICHGHEQLASFLLTKTADLFMEAAGSGKTHGHGQGQRERSLILDAAKHGMGAIVSKLTVLFPQLFDGKEQDTWSRRTILHEALLLPRDRYEDSETCARNAQLILTTLHGILTQLSVEINAQDLVGFTPLHCAAMQGNLKAVKLLLEYGADINVCDKEGRKAWSIALLYRHDACFLEIRRKGIIEASGRKGSTGLESEDAEATTAMTKALADAEAKSRHHAFDLHPHLAADLIQAAATTTTGNLDRVKFLLEELYASSNACDPSAERDGDSLLMVALREKNLPLVRYLATNYGEEIDTSYVNRAGRSVMDLALQSPVLMKLLVHGGHVNPCRPLDSGKHHRTSTHEAVRRGYNLRDWLCGSTLMASMFVPLVDDLGRTPLHDAGAFANVASAKLLINAGLRVDHADIDQKRTPLHEACRSGDVTIVRKMVTTCPQALWLRDAANQLPMLDASYSGNNECLQLVVEFMKQRPREGGEKEENEKGGEAFAAFQGFLLGSTHSPDERPGAEDDGTGTGL